GRPSDHWFVNGRGPWPSEAQTIRNRVRQTPGGNQTSSYFSKAIARDSSGNSMDTASFPGRNFAVCASRRLTSDARVRLPNRGIIWLKRLGRKVSETSLAHDRRRVYR